MKKVILVNGDVATGKSHLAIILRERFKLPLYTKDEFKEYLADQTPCHNYEESHKLSVLAMKMLINSFIKEAQEGNDVILEANFREEHLNEINQIALEFGYSILDLNLIGDVSVLYKRYVERTERGERHPVHSLNPLFDFESFSKYVLDRRKEQQCGKVITINTDDFSYQTDERLFKEINDFLTHIDG